MKTFREVEEWMIGAATNFEDPSEPVCQMFFRPIPNVLRLDSYCLGEDLVFAIRGHEQIEIMFRRGAPIALPIVCGDPVIGPEGTLEFGIEKIESGIWTLNPSLHIPGVIHCFVALYGVPDPAPWERMIVLTDAAGRQLEGSAA